MLANEFACTQQQVKACFSAEKLLVMGSHEPLTAVKLVLVCQNPSGGRKPPPEGSGGPLLFGYPGGVPSWGSETPASPWPRSPRRVLAKAPAEHPNGPFFCHFFDRDFRRHGHAGKEPEKRAKKKCQNFVLFWGGPEGGVWDPFSDPSGPRFRTPPDPPGTPAGTPFSDPSGGLPRAFPGTFSKIPRYNSISTPISEKSDPDFDNS